MMLSTSSLRPTPTRYAIVAWPASWVAMKVFSSIVYSTGCASPISSVSFACWTSAQSMASRPSRRHQTSASSKRCSIITGEYWNVIAASWSRRSSLSSSGTWAFLFR